MSNKVKRTIKNSLITLSVPVIMFILMDTLCVIRTDTHLIKSMLDVNNLIRNVGITSGLAYALSLNLICGRFDLSLGAQRIVGTIIGGHIALALGLSGVWLILFALLAGLFFGFIVGMVFVITRVPPMVLGIGMGLIYECIAYSVNREDGLELFGVEGVQILLEPTLIMVVTILLCGIVIFLTSSTKFGYHLRAISGSQKIAQNSGINIFKNTIGCYTIAGGIVNVSGMMGAAMSNGMKASLGFSSNGTVMASCFPMMLGAVMGRWSNNAVGILAATFAIQFFNLGLTKMEMSEAMTSAINMAAFLILLIVEANQNIFEIKKAEKLRVAEANEKKRRMGITV